MRRLITMVLSSVLAATFLNVVTPPAARADGPSVGLPDTPQTGVNNPAPQPPRSADQASTAALSGDQPGGTTPPAGGGNPKATSLSPSATWQVSSHTGDFTWSYPLRVPPAPGELEPELSLSYASSSVDGRTSATNNQASWVGDGWELESGFIERTYGGCSDDDMGDAKPKTGDQCWRNDNAMSSSNGMLIHESGNRWRPKSDDGSRVERLEGAGNDDNNGEYWKITTPEGMQYFYGSRPESKSTWTVRVYGDDTDEPCHKATFAESWCKQAWRWNLDKVVDPHGNMMIYNYDIETNKYGANDQDTAVDYIRGGALRTIEYGLRADGSTAASGQVEFFTADRCVPGSDCVPSKKDNWPDVPWSSNCGGATCAGNYSPTFWTTKRLAKVVTRVRGANGFTDVDSWALEHQFPNPGDQEKAALWLKSIVHTGHVGTPIALPAVTFEGTAKPNRVAVTTGVGPLNRYRITGIVSEAGGAITVKYAEPDCKESVSMPANPESNTMRCYPVRWSPPGGNERLEYFHKYVVEAIVESDRYQGTSEQRTTYHYLDGAAWHFDTSEFAKEAKKTYGEFRGFRRVRVRTGNPNDPAGPIGEREQRFFRGMDGDRLPGGGRRSASVPDSRGGSHLDSDWFAGLEYESATLNGVDGPVVETTVTTPVARGPSATRGDLKSYLVKPGTVVTHTALSGDAWRKTQIDTRYDDRGQVIEEDDFGDLATAEDDKCTYTSYARNEAAWLISLPYRELTVGAKCTTTPPLPDDVISDTRTGYDGKAIGEPPTAGNETRTEELDGWDGPEPSYGMTSTGEYDVHGRVTKSGDALGNMTTTAYTPAVGGPATMSVVTNPMGHVTSTTIAPAWGQPTLAVDPNMRRTETEYDALGRTTAVWLPNRKKVTGDTASATFAYLIRRDGPPVITASRINARGDYITTKEIYDPLMRLRQVQAPASGGGRLLTDTRYDSQGRIYFTSSPYFHNSAIDDSLWVASEVDKLGATMTEYDGAGRKVASAFRGGGTEKWRTTYVHEGDRVHTTPPQGGTPSTTVTDAEDRVVEIRQGITPDITKYTYTRDGELASIVDPMGNTWRYEYDVRGNVVRVDDPDKGVATMEYDAEDQMTAETDARGIRLEYGYDALGRKTSVTHDDKPVASWTFDTAQFGKGLPATSTRHVGSAAYTTSIGSYNQLNKPVSVTVTVPENERQLAGSYTTELRYDYDGVLAATTMPQIGGLAAEGVVHERDELGFPRVTRGGFNGQTIHYVSDSTYTRQGEIARIQFGEGTKRAWQSYYYDLHTRRLDRTIADVEAPAPMQADVNYAYDPAGNITSIVDSPLAQVADKQCFRYDYLRRLTHAWTPADGCATAPEDAQLAGPGPYRHTYTYDQVGNRLSFATDTATSTYAYPAPGSPRPHAVSSVTTGGTVKSYSYDEVGNTTVRPGQTLEWDVEGHVGKVATSAGDSTFIYDADGERLIRRTPQTTTLYLDGQELTLNNNTGSLSATRYYKHGDSTVAVRTNGTLNWLMGDHQGTSEISVDADTMVVKRRRQAPFGVTRGPSADLPGERGFVGGTDDPFTGLVHIGAREYDASLGRFISVDPVMGSEPQLMNAYAYSNNSPITFSDPTGMYCDGCDYASLKRDAQFTAGLSPQEALQKANKRLAEQKRKAAAAKKRKALADAKRKAAAEKAKRDAESCGFWCSIGKGLANAGKAVLRQAKKITSSPVFKWTGVALGVMGMMGCAACGLISMGMSAVQTAVDCGTGSGKECAAGAASLALGFGAGKLAKAATNTWLKGKGMVEAGHRVSATARRAPAATTGGLRGVGARANIRMNGATMRGKGHVVAASRVVPRAGSYLLGAGSLGLDTAGAAGGFSDD